MNDSAHDFTQSEVAQVYPWNQAPEHLKTERQLADEDGVKPGGPVRGVLLKDPPVLLFDVTEATSAAGTDCGYGAAYESFS